MEAFCQSAGLMGRRNGPWRMEHFPRGRAQCRPFPRAPQNFLVHRPEAIEILPLKGFGQFARMIKQGAEKMFDANIIVPLPNTQRDGTLGEFGDSRRYLYVHKGFLELRTQTTGSLLPLMRIIANGFAHIGESLSVPKGKRPIPYHPSLL